MKLPQVKLRASLKYEMRSGLKFLMQKYPSSPFVCHSSCLQITFHGSAFLGLKFGGKFYMQEKEPRRWKSTPTGCKRSAAACVWLLKFQFPLRIWRVKRTCKTIAKHLKIASGSFRSWRWLSRYIDWLRALRTMVRSSSPSRVKNFHFYTSSRPALESTQPPIQRGPFPGR
jgi:hypothetical protein